MQLGSGVEAFQVREVRKRNVTSRCFFVLHTDGTEEDFSLRKCLNRLFPIYAQEHLAKLVWFCWS